MCTHTDSLCFVKVSLVLRGLCFPLGGREAPCSQPSLDGTQLCLMLSLLLVSASGAVCTRVRSWEHKKQKHCLYCPPADLTVRTNLASLHWGDWIFFRPKGDSEWGKEGQMQTTAVNFILCLSRIYEIVFLLTC